jgi:hypothetical protein
MPRPRKVPKFSTTALAEILIGPKPSEYTIAGNVRLVHDPRTMDEVVDDEKREKRTSDWICPGRLPWKVR